MSSVKNFAHRSLRLIRNLLIINLPFKSRNERENCSSNSTFIIFTLHYNFLYLSLQEEYRSCVFPNSISLNLNVCRLPPPLKILRAHYC